MKVIPKPKSTETFEAFCFDRGLSTDDVIDWARDYDNEATASIVIEKGDRPRHVTISTGGQVLSITHTDWMVRHPDGKIDVMSDEQFNATFQRSFA